MELEAVRQSYARWASIYDETFGLITSVGRRRAVRHISRRGGKVLEVGVGTGLSLGLYDPAISVTGVDFSVEMLEKARQKVRAQNLSHVKSLLKMDARQLDFKDNSFDTVAAMHFVSVVPEPERAIAEMARVVRPGGEIVVVNHFASEGGALAAIERMSARLSNRLGWHSDFRKERILGVRGLSVVDERAFPPLGLMTFLVLRKAA